jgi:hypothetical protein
VLKHQVPGTVPLRSWWSAARADNVLSAAAATDGALAAAGYELLRTEGFIFTSALTNTTAMQLYWNAATTDHATSTTGAPAFFSGYSFVRNEGFALSVNP